MTQTTLRPAGRRIAALAMTTLVAIALAACGSPAPASTAPSTAASQPATAPTITPTTAASSPSVPSTAPATATGSATAGVDAAAGLTIGAPYTLTALPSILQQTMETQMATSLGAFGSSISVGFRQVTGGAGSSILMVMGFPSGTLNAAAYRAALSGMGGSLGATFTITTVSGVEVSSGKAATGGVAVFHVADHMLMVFAQTEGDAMPVATALIAANQ